MGKVGRQWTTNSEQWKECEKVRRQGA